MPKLVHKCLAQIPTLLAHYKHFYLTFLLMSVFQAHTCLRFSNSKKIMRDGFEKFKYTAGITVLKSLSEGSEKRGHFVCHLWIVLLGCQTENE